MEKDPRIGWSPTTLPAETRTSYEQVITELGAVLRLHRTVEVAAGTVKKPGTPPAVCGCGCGCGIRVPKAVLAAGPIDAGCAGVRSRWTIPPTTREAERDLGL